MEIDKDKREKINKYNEDLYKSLGFVSKSEDMSFIFKKTERISQGLYLATNHIKDSDYVKWFIRELSVDMLNSAIKINNPVNSKIEDLYGDFLIISFNIISILKLISNAGLINQNNSLILIEEITSIVDFVSKKMLSKSFYSNGLVLNNDFFNNDDQGQKIYYPKTNNLSVFENTKNNRSIFLDTAKNEANTSLLKDKKDNRRNQILDLLKRQNNLTVKDFLKVITGCSEKTIQRELLALTQIGLIIKEGERRWSRYSLKGNQ